MRFAVSGMNLTWQDPFFRKIYVRQDLQDSIDYFFSTFPDERGKTISAYAEFIWPPVGSYLSIRGIISNMIICKLFIAKGGLLLTVSSGSCKNPKYPLNPVNPV